MKAIAVIYILFIGLIIYLANTGQLGPVADLIRRVPYGDAVLHAILMGTLAVVVNYLLRMKMIAAGRFQILLGTCLVVAFVIGEECSQLYIANRTFSFIDLGADFIGIGLFGLLARRLQKNPY